MKRFTTNIEGSGAGWSRNFHDVVGVKHFPDDSNDSVDDNTFTRSTRSIQYYPQGPKRTKIFRFHKLMQLVQDNGNDVPLVRIQPVNGIFASVVLQRYGDARFSFRSGIVFFYFRY